MENKIVQLQEIDNNRKFLGNKTLNLKKCVDWGFNVPKFVSLPSNISRELFENEIFRKKIGDEVANILRCEKYAVRSSALIEDGANESMAGQFLTKIKADASELHRCIYEVLRQADSFLENNLEDFSIIIQEYISPDISGVAFTRNPTGGREMILEYGLCEGEKIVSGEIAPKRVAFLWSNEKPENIPKSLLPDQTIGKFKELEEKNGFPQDIEWCIKAGKFYLLQTRPITTISKKQYEQIIFLEKFLPRDGKYYFEKTELSEIVPRPTTATFDLLKLIYSEGGPVHKVYKKYGIAYENTRFLKIIGNELYVDKEKEIKGLMPAYSYFSNQDFVPRLCDFSKLFPTLKNFFFLNGIRTKETEKLFSDLKKRIEQKNEEETHLENALKRFLVDYELVFKTNLLSSLSIKKAELLMRKECVSYSEIIASHSYFVDFNKYHVSRPGNLTGNSLEISDTSAFIANENVEGNTSDKITHWLQKIPEYKKNIIGAKIKEAVIYNRLREFGRWLAVKNINAIKEMILELARKKGFKEPENVFFANLNDSIRGDFEEKDCIKRKKAYAGFNSFLLPNVIGSSLVEKKTKITGVSPGVTEGLFLNEEMAENGNHGSQKIILYTEILSPDLTKYFGKVAGIVSKNGGLLSHLAIVAREKKIPVVVGFSAGKNGIELGDKIQIDGSSGRILKINIDHKSN